MQARALGAACNGREILILPRGQQCARAAVEAEGGQSVGPHTHHLGKPQPLQKALIVTSDYHVARALELCPQEGISATGKGSPSKPEYFIKNHLREGLSWVKLWIQTLLGVD